MTRSMKRSLLAAALVLAACAPTSIAQQTPPAPVASPVSAPAAATNADPAVQRTDIVWARHGTLDLGATIYKPKSTKGLLPVVIDVHGGAWASLDRTGDTLYCTDLAKSGHLVVSIDFRQGPNFKHPAASADVAAAVRYVRLNAKALGADPERIGLIGSSSGAHLALLEALRPNVPGHAGTPIVGPDGGFAAHDQIDASVDYVVAMWPVSDPAYRYRYAKRASLDRLSTATEAYFGDEAAMWDASIQRIVTAGETTRLPPILVVQPGDDANIPQEMTFDLLRAWQARGGRADYAFYPGQPHAFGHRPSEATTNLLATVRDFVVRQN